MRLFRRYSFFAKAVALIIAACCVSSCRTPRDVTYFSNINDNDRHSIVVTSKDPQLASLFNLPIVAQRTSQPGVTSLAVPRSSTNEVASYVVDSKGDIQFPVLGPIHIGGMKRDEVAAYIRHELVSDQQTSFRVDLTDVGSLTASPVYYLQQDDVIYVSPNDVRKRQTTANGNAPLTPSFWISIASLAATIAMLIFK